MSALEEAMERLRDAVAGGLEAVDDTPGGVEAVKGAVLIFRRARAVLAAYDATAGETEEPFFGIRRTDGEDIMGEFAWVKCDGPDDWHICDDDPEDEPVEYEIIRLVATVVARRTFAPVAAGGATPDPAERVWRCASPVARVDPLHACGPASPHTAFGCGLVPSEEGPST